MRRALPAFLVLATACPAAGHGLHVVRGELTVEPDRIVATLVSAAEHDRPDARWLVDALAIHDERGERLAARLVPSGGPGDADRTTIRAELPAPPRHLTLRLAPPPTVAGLIRRLDLVLHSAGLARPEQVQLTSGGNAETLSFAWSETERARRLEDPCSLDAERHRLRDVQGSLVVGRSGCRLDVSLPVPLLETWRPLARARRDVLTPGEQASAGAAALALVRDSVGVTVDGRAAGVAHAAVAFRGLDDGLAPEGALSAWTARVLVTLELEATSPRRVDIDWRLFNASVLTGRLLVQDDAGCTAHRVSTYEPVVSWRR